jgi:valyl-tRNA synthetase
VTALPGFSTGSVHRASWPSVEELPAGVGSAPELVLTAAADVLRLIRKAKSDAKRSIRAEVTSVLVSDTVERIAAVATVVGDLRGAGNVAQLELVELVELVDGVAPAVVVRLAEPSPAP